MIVNDLERLVAIDQIRDLMARYARYADAKQWDDLARLFLPGGTFQPLDVEGNPLRPLMAGRDEIAHAVGATVGSAQPIHHLFSYEINVTSPVTAEGVMSMEDFIIRRDDEELMPDDHGVKPFRAMHGYGHYHARYERADGEWFIADMTQTRVKLDFIY